MFRHTLLSFATLALVAPGAAAQTTVKVATVARSTRRTTRRCSTWAPNGRPDVRPREADGLRRRHAGQRGGDAAHDAPRRRSAAGRLLMLPGLSSIEDGFGVFGIPFLFASDAEAKHVLERMGPMMEKRMEARGFKVLAWGSAGWVQLFSKNPLNTLADIKAAKIFTTQGDDRMVQWYKQNGFRPVPLNSGDIPAQLKLPNGMIDAAPMPPYAASLLQVHRDAKYMLDVDFAPLFGALVMTNSAWNKLSAEDKTAVAAAAKSAEKRLLGEAVQLDTNSINAMKTRIDGQYARRQGAGGVPRRGRPSGRDHSWHAGAGRHLRCHRPRARRVSEDEETVIRAAASSAITSVENLVATRPRRHHAAAARGDRDAQLLQRGIPGAGPFTLNLTLWVGLLGAAIGAREGKLLTLATGEFLPKGTINIAHVVSGFAGAAIAMMFAVGGLALVQSERGANDRRRRRPRLGLDARVPDRLHADRAPAGVEGNPHCGGASSR